VAIPLRRPQRAQALSANLIGLSIEMDRWDTWAGPEVGKPNVYVKQMLRNLGDKVGSPPCIRVGANSQDHGIINPDVPVIDADFGPISDLVPFPEAKTVYIGRDFYALSGNFAEGTKLQWDIWGINLKSNDIEETARQASLLAETFEPARNRLLSKVELEYVQIGNEPDFFYPNPRAFIEQWHLAATRIKDILRFGQPGAPKLQAPSLAGIKPCEWSLDAIFDQGLLEDDGSLISDISVHHYFATRTGRPTSQPNKGDLMNKLTIRLLMSRFHRDIARAAEEGLTIMLGETNTYGLHGVPGVSNTAEAAIWMVDYALHCASIGLRRLHFHHGVGFDYNLIQPISGINDGTGKADRPHVLPSYYGAIVVNEAIGSTGPTSISEVYCNRPTLSAYAIWDDQDEMIRLVVINSAVYLKDSEGPRPHEPIHLAGIGERRPIVKRLSTPFTDASTGITWAGGHYEDPSGEFTIDIDSRDRKQEMLTDDWLSLPASEVAILYF
ncbi:hypothetical protein HD553DRAFT_366973, partial [Filobasidium floriforme]|uniref:uncharacterized protein n=1 Tax=Filobasidium floriforme TaxID=5210 RepID=UPI001E8E318B